MTILFFIVGLTFLIIGAEALVRGASQISVTFGVSPLIIGLTVVAFGTSAPELAVSIKSALSGQANIALGNVIGSNIFNVLFILGISALIIPLVVSQKLIRFDVPFMIMVSVIVFIFSFDELISQIDGLILISILVAYLLFLIFQGRKEITAIKETHIQEFVVTNKAWHSALKNIGLVLVGLLLLIGGSRWLVDSAVYFAQYLGVSDLIIGLTIVAAGTSMPEVVTSIIAAVRGERDVAVGNVVGSNIFNLLGVLGITSIVAPSGIEVAPSVITFDFPIMIAVAFICLPIFFTGGTISRNEGGVLLMYYIVYCMYLILAASHHDALPKYSATLMYFILPITALIMSVLVAQQVLKK
jgi:cation:H+ antiporter